MCAGVMKELGAKWIVAFYDYVCSNPNLVVNRFLQAGIPSASENGVPGIVLPEEDGLLSDDQVGDPFVDIHSDSDELIKYLK